MSDPPAEATRWTAAMMAKLAPDLVARNSVGYGSAAQLLVTAGDNPDRLKSEASFAALCGASPIPASSGKTDRHRLNCGGDRAANSALHIIAGMSKLEAIRCIKRYIAREVFNLIRSRYREINQGPVRRLTEGRPWEPIPVHPLYDPAAVAIATLSRVR